MRSEMERSMNPLAFVRYVPRLMLADTIDMDSESELAHRRLIDFLWSNDGPPQAVDSKLAAIAKVELKRWHRVRAELEVKGWRKEDGLFVHGGAMKTLAESKQKYAVAVTKAKLAAEARWGKPKQCLGTAQALPDSVINFVPSSSSLGGLGGIRNGGGPTLEDFKQRLNSIFHRPENCRWSYAEEHALVEILASPAASAELTELEAFSKKPGSFFPQSVESLLANWQKTLDRARNFAEGQLLNKGTEHPRSGKNSVRPDHAKGF
jgi:uncharacterized protein YdaU (DUF1376 family)